MTPPSPAPKIQLNPFEWNHTIVTPFSKQFEEVFSRTKEFREFMRNIKCFACMNVKNFMMLFWGSKKIFLQKCFEYFCS